MLPKQRRSLSWAQKERSYRQIPTPSPSFFCDCFLAIMSFTHRRACDLSTGPPWQLWASHPRRACDLCCIGHRSQLRIERRKRFNAQWLSGGRRSGFSSQLHCQNFHHISPTKLQRNLQVAFQDSCLECMVCMLQEEAVPPWIAARRNKSCRTNSGSVCRRKSKKKKKKKKKKIDLVWLLHKSSFHELLDTLSRNWTPEQTNKQNTCWMQAGT
jgi:hypothetical protein